MVSQMSFKFTTILLMSFKFPNVGFSPLSKSFGASQVVQDFFPSTARLFLCFHLRWDLSIAFPPPKSNIEPENDGLEDDFPLSSCILRFHVNLRGCKLWSCWSAVKWLPGYLLG